MARVGGRERPGWVWPAIILLAILILGVIAWAFLASSAPVSQPTEVAPAPAPAPAPSVTTIEMIASAPSSYFGKDVTVDVRINRTVGEQGMYLVDSEGGSELLAVLGTRVADTILRQGDMASFSGTVREVNDVELNRLGDTVDTPTLDILANEEFYLSVSSFEAKPSPAPAPLPGEPGL